MTPEELETLAAHPWAEELFRQRDAAIEDRDRLARQLEEARSVADQAIRAGDYATLTAAWMERDELRAERDRLRKELRVAAASYHAEVQRLREDVIGPLRAERDQLREEAAEACETLLSYRPSEPHMAGDLTALPLPGLAKVRVTDLHVSDSEIARTQTLYGDLLHQARTERDQLRAHILDIDAHATPYGDIPDEPGYVGTYLVTAGALHRALGKVEHSAPSCAAEAERDRYAEVVEAARVWRAQFSKPKTHFPRMDALIAAVDRLTPGDETPGGEP